MRSCKRLEIDLVSAVPLRKCRRLDKLYRERAENKQKAFMVKIRPQHAGISKRSSTSKKTMFGELPPVPKLGPV